MLRMSNYGFIRQLLPPNRSAPHSRGFSLGVRIERKSAHNMSKKRDKHGNRFQPQRVCQHGEPNSVRAYSYLRRLGLGYAVRERRTGLEFPALVY
jgi:hypothetical protein